ncbi:MAG: hypothetical protein RR420_01280 [Anaerovoracaceae bacterium]
MTKLINTYNLIIIKDKATQEVVKRMTLKTNQTSQQKIVKAVLNCLNKEKYEYTYTCI